MNIAFECFTDSGGEFFDITALDPVKIAEPISEDIKEKDS